MCKLTKDEIEYFTNTLALLLENADSDTSVKMQAIANNLITNYHNYLTNEDKITIVKHLLKGAIASIEELKQNL